MKFSFSESLAFAVLVAAVSLATPQMAGAQSASIDSAVAAARQKLIALTLKDYLYVAQHAPPEQLRRSRVAFDSLFEQDSSGLAIGTLFGTESPATLRKWSDAQFAAALVRFWVATSANVHYSNVLRLETSGGLRAGSDTVLVVYRWLYRDGYQGPHFVQPMVRCARGWCSELPANIPAILAMMRMRRPGV